jgi:hypothetical protein
MDDGDNNKSLATRADGKPATKRKREDESPAFAAAAHDVTDNQIVVQDVAETNSFTISVAADSIVAHTPSNAKTASDDGENDPANWFADTDPFIVVRRLAREEITNDEIQKVLNENSIETLQQLYDKSDVVYHLLQKGRSFVNFGSFVLNALGRPRKTAEQILGEVKIVFDNTCIPQKCYDLYAAKAVSVKPALFAEFDVTKRKPNFSLVLGSSGSGKTLFAIRRIPELLFGMDETTYFRLHFRASNVTNLINKHKEKAENIGFTEQTLDFPKAVSAIVDTIIGELLSGKGLDDTEILNIPIHITIDEAGAEISKVYIGTAEAIEEIVDVVREKGKFKFPKGVHVTVAGTRLETSTSTILSTVQTTKFRMQAWTDENFDALVDNAKHPLASRVKQVVHGFPILEDLTTNARCAFYVLESMERVSLLRENRVKSSVPVIVATAADNYVANNGLAYLEHPKEKWLVARSVFRAVDDSTKCPGVAFFPLFKDLDTVQLRSAAGSILDINVESNDGTLQLAAGSRFAITMTPALAIVVANLLNADAKVSWDWQGFETTVMLSEMKRMIVHSQEFPIDTIHYPDKLIVQLQSPLPASRTTRNVSIPVVNKYTVVLNGPKAKYADVIAPYRLVQAKFSKDNGKALNLDLLAELNKMGLTSCKDHTLHQFVTSVFWNFWETGQEAPSWLVGESIPQMVDKDDRFECYPFNTLNKRVVYETFKMVKGSSNDKKWVLKGENDEEVALPTAFHPDRPVTAVFATNCSEFRIFVDTAASGLGIATLSGGNDTAASKKGSTISNKKGVSLKVADKDSEGTDSIATWKARPFEGTRSKRKGTDLTGTDEDLEDETIKFPERRAALSGAPLRQERKARTGTDGDLQGTGTKEHSDETDEDLQGTKEDLQGTKEASDEESEWKEDIEQATTRISIKPADVDWEGNVKQEDDLFSRLGLRENVKIRFLFY